MVERARTQTQPTDSTGAGSERTASKSSIMAYMSQPLSAGRVAWRRIIRVVCGPYIVLPALAIATGVGSLTSSSWVPWAFRIWVAVTAVLAGSILALTPPLPRLRDGSHLFNHLDIGACLPVVLQNGGHIALRLHRPEGTAPDLASDNDVDGASLIVDTCPGIYPAMSRDRHLVQIEYVSGSKPWTPSARPLRPRGTG